MDNTELKSSLDDEESKILSDLGTIYLELATAKRDKPKQEVINHKLSSSASIKAEEFVVDMLPYIKSYLLCANIKHNLHQVVIHDTSEEEYIKIDLTLYNISNRKFLDRLIDNKLISNDICNDQLPINELKISLLPSANTKHVMNTMKTICTLVDVDKIYLRKRKKI